MESGSGQNLRAGAGWVGFLLFFGGSSSPLLKMSLPTLWCLQSVSALLEKFKKSDQAFDIDAEADSDPGDPAAEDYFDADVLDRTVARDLEEFSEKVEACRIAPGSSR